MKKLLRETLSSCHYYKSVYLGLCVVSHLSWPPVHWGGLNTVVEVPALDKVPRYDGPADPTRSSGSDAMSTRAAAMRCVTVSPGRPVRRLHDALHHPLGPAVNLLNRN